MGANGRGHTYIAVSTALVVLSTIVVGIRIAARWVKSSLGWDDYAICVSIVLAYSMLGQAIFWARDGGLGKHMTELTAQEKTTFQQASITLNLLAGGLVLAWCLAVFITVLVQCRPISYNWNKNQRGTCINAKSFFFGNAISNLLIDVIILALPIPMVLQLQLRLSQKLTILGIFLLGSFVCVASVMRVVTLDIFNDDTSYSIMEAATWTFVEPCVGIICACLPTMRPLLRSLFSSFSWSTENSKDAPVGRNYGMQRMTRSGKTNEEAWGDRFDDEYALTAGSSKSRVHVDDTL
ncbi:uncharacterized protein PGRI_043580 [Penicillium griseofulvum]|uniref:Rhodopsin domain-containing protein n=1 Tax=Penicillium patulum TaxID=5078 RepID=A0A135LNQ7_PENPA|nr:uncharacterized protein PGRI_043580 [Penicillium griseofulvum]KXG50591.1 hypothetical protein PGRI_043580 [Penicillium griseofulvum]